MRIPAVLLLAATVVAGSLAPAQATTRKPLKKTYAVRLVATPDATEETACSGPTRNNVNMHVEQIKVAGRGTLRVKITGFTGDWDTSLYNTAGKQLTQGGGTNTPDTLTNTAPTETLFYRAGSGQTLSLRVCNQLGSPDATVSYTYTYW